MLTRRILLPSAATLIAAAAARPSRADEGSDNLPSLRELSRTIPPRPIPDASFATAEGKSVPLASFRGRALVVNFWATWCVPCVLELPALEAMARALAPDDIGVLPLSSDKGGLPVVQRFLADRGVGGLPVLLDPQGAASRAFATRGIPTTVLIGRDGMERARMEGAADWASEASVATVRAILAG